MSRCWISTLFLVATIAAQGPSDPTGTSLNGIYLGNNPDCGGIPRSWQWPLPLNACYRASVLGILGERELAPAIAPFSFVTGHTDPATGREFALLSAWNALVIVDAHDISETGPTRITPQFWVMVDTSVPAVHRGTASFGQYVYESNAFRASLRVFQVAVNPSTPSQIVVSPLPDVVLPQVGTSYRLTVDKERGHLYVPTIHGLYIYDVNGPNGAVPLLLAVWRGWLAGAGIVPSFSVHLQRDGPITRAVVSEYLTPGYTHISFLDVTNLPSGNPAVDPWTPPQWVSFLGSMPGTGNAHSAWMPKDGLYLYNSIGDVATVVYDMSGFAFYGANRVLLYAETPLLVLRNGSNPPELLTYPELPMRHMGLQGLGYTGYVSSWQEGFVLYDVRPGNSNPHQILAQVDTSLSSSTYAYGGPTWSLLYPGAFSVYREQDSGVIYVSDDANGLFLIRANVGHMHRFGAGWGELYNGKMMVPRITAEHAPPRAHQAGAFDADQRITIANLIPGRSVILLAGTAGLPTGVSFPTPNSRCLNYMGGLVANPIFLFANGAGQIDISLPPVLPDQFRLFVQAFAFQPGSVQCSASTRGTWFGLAEQR